MVEDDAVFYSTRDIRDFGIGMKHRTMRVILMSREVSEEKLIMITKSLWEKEAQDVDELVALFYLPDMLIESTAYAIGSCMKDGEVNIRYER